jgi:hypothetical protein
MMMMMMTTTTIMMMMMVTTTTTIMIMTLQFHFSVGLLHPTGILIPYQDMHRSQSELELTQNLITQ